MSDAHAHARARASALACWSAPVEPVPVDGGITNQNFRVDHKGERFFVRIGGDIPVHGVLRFHELAASRAAHAAGVSPEVVHHEPGALVLRFIEGRTLTPADVRADLARVLDLVARVHEQVGRHLRGPTLAFWAFHVVRDYVHTLRDAGRAEAELRRFIEIADALARAVGPVHLVFAHNDLLAQNFLDDGKRLWLIDWDYAGWNSALFDLGGLASNCDLAPEAEAAMLARFGITDERAYAAMKCASLLREALWSMVSEKHSAVSFDFAAYTRANLQKFHAAYARFQERYA